MPTTRYGLSSRSFARAVAAVTVLGAAYGVVPASPAAAREVPPQPLAISGSFDVFLVLPATNGLSATNTSQATGSQTTEQLSAFSLSSTAPNAAGAGSTGAAAGKAGTVASQATATMPLDTTSTNLLRNVLEGQVLNPVQVEFRRSSAGKEATFLTYTFKDVVISSYQLQDTSGATTVQIVLAFQGISLSFGTGVSSRGGIVTPPAGWSITTNRAV
jgi:type VI protein secretion system component Hcp